MQAGQKRETPLAGGEFAEEDTENMEIVEDNFPDHKMLATMRAAFALCAHELHVVRKGKITYYEVRLWGQCRTCTPSDLQGVLTQIGGAM